MILVVDDQPELVEVICQFLICYHYKVIGVTSSEEALKVAEQNKVSCLITDIAMPGINGLELSKRFKKLFPRTKVICLSAYAEMLKEDLQEAEVDFQVPKPFIPDELLNCVEQSMEKLASA